MDFIDTIKEATKQASEPKEKALTFVKEEIEEMAKAGYSSKTLTPSDFIHVTQKALNWSVPTALQVLEVTSYIRKSLQAEGFDIYATEYADKSGYCHIVKW